MPNVAIIIQTYNHANFIEKNLQSILEQECNFSFKIIVHDDASTDGTKEILEKFKNNNPEIFDLFLQEHNTHSMHLSKKLSFLRPFRDHINKFDYVAFCEGDDFWIKKNKLQIQVDFLQNNKNFSCCFHSFAVLNNKTGHITYPTNHPNVILSPYDLKTNKIFARKCTVLQRNTGGILLYFDAPNHGGIYESSFIKNGDLFRNSQMGYFGKGMYFGNFVGSVFRANEESSWEHLPEVEKAQHRAVSSYWIAKFHERMGDLDAAEHWAKGALANMHAGLQDIFEKKSQQTQADRLLFETIDQIRLDMFAGNHRKAQRQLKLALKKNPSNSDLLGLQEWIKREI
ncbi:glycosyltransferase [Marinospirillum sp.]|uniref:glycosyltransferase n=1 Tax=Marinospirillum sp. TaxID=2183934 RepID=UPI00384C4AA9